MRFVLDMNVGCLMSDVGCREKRFSSLRMNWLLYCGDCSEVCCTILRGMSDVVERQTVYFLNFMTKL